MSDRVLRADGNTAIFYRPGDNRTWRARRQGDGWAIQPDMFGSLPPANEAGADPVEVEAARLASADVAYVKIPRLGLREWSDGAMTGWEQHAFEPYTYVQFRDEPDMLAGWLARQIVEEEP